MLESKVENYLVRRIEELGLVCVKFVPEQRPGMPDRLVLLKGTRVVWVELKTDGGRLSELQRYRHAELRKLGHEVAVLWNKDQVDEFVDELRKKEKDLSDL